MADLPVSDRTEQGIEARRAEIVSLVHQHGYATIDHLATRFQVSAQTIRRDIRTLASQHLVARYHGGAGLPSADDRLAYPVRKVSFAAEKRAIAQIVARHVPDGASLFIDIGTTMEAVAEALTEHQGLRVITNHMTVASILSEHGDFEIIVPGGILRNRDRAITGEAASEFVGRFKVGYGIFGIGAIDNDGELLDYDYRDVQLSKAAMAISRRRFVALDHSKFNGDAMVRVAHLSDIDAVFTDAPPPSEIAELLRAYDVAVHIAQPASLVVVGAEDVR